MSKPFSLTYVTYDPNDELFGPVFALLSLAPPFCVASLTCHIVITRDLRGFFLLSGQVVTAAICAVLKRIIRQPRPTSSFDNNEQQQQQPKEDDNDHGMPSNHAAFVSFCAVFSIYFAITQYHHNECHYNIKSGKIKKDVVKFVKRWTPSIGATIIAIGCSYSRVHLGYHTISQVMVGSMIGCLIGVMFSFLYGGVYKERFAPWIENSWLGRDWDVRSYHDILIFDDENEDDCKKGIIDVAHFMAMNLDTYRRAQAENNNKKKKS